MFGVFIREKVWLEIDSAIRKEGDRVGTGPSTETDGKDRVFRNVGI
jgi:hypothetical protein